MSGKRSTVLKKGMVTNMFVRRGSQTHHYTLTFEEQRDKSSEAISSSLLQNFNVFPRVVFG